MKPKKSINTQRRLEFIKRILNDSADNLERKGWCRKNFALTKTGGSVVYWSPAAERFCATGMVYRTSDDLCKRLRTFKPEKANLINHAMMALARAFEPGYNGQQPNVVVVRHNDNIVRDKRYVIRALRRAARSL